MSKQYHDQDGNPVSLDKLCRIEPAWAASRIRQMTEQLDEVKKRDAGQLFGNDGELSETAISWFAREGYSTPILKIVASQLLKGAPISTNASAKGGK